MDVNYDLIGRLLRGPRRREVLREFAQASFPLSSRHVSKLISMEQANVVRILNELEKAGAIKRVTKGKRNRLYSITVIGRESLKELKKMMPTP